MVTHVVLSTDHTNLVIGYQKLLVTRSRDRIHAPPGIQALHTPEAPPMDISTTGGDIPDAWGWESFDGEGHHVEDQGQAVQG